MAAIKKPNTLYCEENKNKYQNRKKMFAGSIIQTAKR